MTMSRLAAPAALLAVLTCASLTAEAQEFRIYTRIYNERAEADANGNSPVIARSLSLFHAGKVYDYINTVDEVIVFEPAHERLTVLDTARSLKTTIGLKELERLVGAAREETEKYLATAGSPDGPSPAVAAALRFQLDPQFEESFDGGEKRLELAGSHLNYRAQCAEVEVSEALDAYLRYADWICRLNYVLHPQSLFPAPRLALNAALRRHRVLPVEVDLQAEVAHKVHLRAEHRIHWQLDAKDRSLIHHWETLLRDEGTKGVTFRKYQRAALADSRKGR